MRILSIGELLWDVFPDKELLGGAPLNFSVSAKRLGNEVAFLSAVGTDPRGERAISAVRGLGLDTQFLQIVPGQPTGTAQVTTDGHGNASFLLQRPAAFDHMQLDDALLARIVHLRPDWVYCGTLALTNARNEAFLYRVLAALPGARCFYDVNLREGQWDLPLVDRLCARASTIKLNDSEARELLRQTRPEEAFSLTGFCKHWTFRHPGKTLCITLGGQGCAIWDGRTVQAFPGFPITVVDTVGAGDAFAAAYLHGSQLRWPLERTAAFANALGAIIASHAGATPAWTIAECMELAQRNERGPDHPA